MDGQRIQIFLQYFNPELLRAYGTYRSAGQKHLLQTSLALTRCALASSTAPLLVPASSLFECSYFQLVVSAMKPIIDAGLLEFVSPTPDIEEYVAKKRREFRDQRGSYRRYYSDGVSRIARKVTGVNWRPRVRLSASREIASAWRAELSSDEGIWKQILEEEPHLDLRSTNLEKVEEAIYSAPNKLDGRAFVYDSVAPLLPFEANTKNSSRINLIINRGYIDSYIEEYRAAILVETPLGDLGCGMPSTRADGSVKTLSYRALSLSLQRLGLRRAIESDLSWEELLELKTDPYFEWVMAWLVSDLRPDSGGAFRAALRRARRRAPTEGLKMSNKHTLSTVSEHVLRLYDYLAPTLEPLSDDVRGSKRAAPLLIDGPTQLNRNPMINKRDVFLIHGRDLTAATSVRNLLRSLSLNPIHWEEAVALTGNASPFVLDILNAGLSRAQAVIVLFSPDEQVRLNDRLGRVCKLGNELERVRVN